MDKTLQELIINCLDNPLDKSRREVLGDWYEEHNLDRLAYCVRHCVPDKLEPPKYKTTVYRWCSRLMTNDFPITGCPYCIPQEVYHCKPYDKYEDTPTEALAYTNLLVALLTLAYREIPVLTRDCFNENAQPNDIVTIYRCNDCKRLRIIPNGFTPPRCTHCISNNVSIDGPHVVNVTRDFAETIVNIDNARLDQQNANQNPGTNQ